METGRKTKNCIEPWRSVQFEAGGSITPCCSGTIKGNFGNIHTDYFDTLARGNQTDIFANKDYQLLREGLLSGNVQRSCVSCRMVHDEDITTTELRQRVINHLESQGMKTEGIDLTKAYAFHECGGNITNRCNFSCIYCSHSGEGGHAGYFQNQMEPERFLSWIDFLCERGLKIFNFCGIGEITIYPEWQHLCDEILHRHPQLRLRGISNFGKKLSDSELNTLARFDLVHVSCDTLDAETYAWLRKGGKLPVLLENIQRLKARLTGEPDKDPKIALNVTVTDMIVDKLEDLFRYAAANNLFVHLSSLFVMEGSIASKTSCVNKITDMDMSRIPFVREKLYDLPRRLKAQNPLSSVWEYKFLYKEIMQKADAVNLNRFVPGTDDLIYSLFYKSHPRNPDAYLRKFWLSFDDVLKGIYITTGKEVKIDLSHAPVKVMYRAVWCRERLDGNFDIIPGAVDQAVVAANLTISSENGGELYNGLLFEILSCESVQASSGIRTLLAPSLPGNVQPLLIREAFLKDEEDAVAQRLVDSQEPVVLWCAGLRTLQMLSNTCLNQANIRMIIDGNPSKKGQLFCGHVIHSPDDLGDFPGKIVVIHASSPEQVEQQIRKMGIKNETIIL